MIAPAGRMAEAASESSRRARRSRQVVEVRVVIDLRLPQGGVMPSQQQFSFPVEVPHFGFTAQMPAATAVPTVTSTFDHAQASSAGPASPESQVPTQAETLTELYERLCASRERGVNEAKTVKADCAAVREYQDWLCSQNDTRISTPRVGMSKTLENSQLLEAWSRDLRTRKIGGSVASVAKRLNAVMKLGRACFHSGLISKLPKCPTRGDLQLMVPVTDDSVDDADLQGEPVTIDELKAMLTACDGAEWPCLGKVDPAEFWRLVLLSSYCYGFRTQDWFASRSGEKRGLLWSGVIDDPQCPRLPDVSNPAGWVWFLVHKTKRKDVKAGRTPKLLLPLSSKLRSMIEPFRGLDPERVFPLPNNSHSWSREVRGILERCQLDDASRLAAKKPLIRLSEGKRAVASFRKGCADMWATTIDGAAASYVLKHSASDSETAAVTQKHYLKQYRPLRAITAAIESLPIWS